MRLVLRWIPSERSGVSAWHCRVGDFERLQACSERIRRKRRSCLSPQDLPQGKTVADEFLFPSDLNFFSFLKFSGDFRIRTKEKIKAICFHGKRVFPLAWFLAS